MVKILNIANGGSMKETPILMFEFVVFCLLTNEKKAKDIPLNVIYPRLKEKRKVT